MKRLNLGEASAAWLAKLEALPPPTNMPVPNSAALARLGVSPEDAAEVLRTMPSPEGDPELWWLFERSHRLLVSGLASGSKPGDAPLPPPPAFGVFAAQLVLLSLDAIRECHRQFGVPDDISWETLSLLGRAMAEYRSSNNKPGIRLTRWDWLRFSGWLYQVGRLEMTVSWLRSHPKEAGPLFWYDDETAGCLGFPFRVGDFAFGIHVPAGDPLSPQACDDSISRLRTLSAKSRIATCTSWLLDDQLREYLPQDSNILRFQSRFQLVPGAREADESVLRAIFGPEYSKDLEALPQRTTLERCAVEHLRRGGHWHMRTGWLEL